MSQKTFPITLLDHITCIVTNQLFYTALFAIDHSIIIVIHSI